MKHRIVLALAASTLLAAPLAYAQEAPRVDQVDQRLDNQQQRIDQGVASGQINAKQAAKDEKHDAKIAKRASADEAKHNGHLTKAEHKHLNKSLDKNSARIHHQRKEGTQG